MSEACLIESNGNQRLYRTSPSGEVSYLKNSDDSNEIEFYDPVIIRIIRQVLKPGEIQGIGLAKSIQNLSQLTPHANIHRVLDIYSWEESRSVFYIVFITENFDGTLRHELASIISSRFSKSDRIHGFSDDQMLSLITDVINGLEFLRRRNLVVTIDIDHIYKVNDAYKWTSFSNQSYENPQLSIQEELKQLNKMFISIIQEVLLTKDQDQGEGAIGIREKYGMSQRAIDFIGLAVESSNVGLEFYVDFNFFITNLHESENIQLHSKMIEMLDIQISDRTKSELTDAIKKYKPKELLLRLLSSSDSLWRTARGEIAKIGGELKRLSLTSERNMLDTSVLAKFVRETCSSNSNLETMNLNLSGNSIDDNIWVIFEENLRQLRLNQFSLCLKENYIGMDLNQFKGILSTQHQLLILQLDFRENSLKSNFIKKFSESISRLSMLQQMDVNLNNNYAGNIGVISLLNVISKLNYLSNLKLGFQNNGVEEIGLLAISELRQLVNLVQLSIDLSNNNLLPKRENKPFAPNTLINSPKNNLKNIFELNPPNINKNFLLQSPIQEADEQSSKATLATIVASAHLGEEGINNTIQSSAKNLTEKRFPSVSSHHASSSVWQKGHKGSQLNIPPPPTAQLPSSTTSISAVEERYPLKKIPNDLLPQRKTNGNQEQQQQYIRVTNSTKEINPAFQFITGTQLSMIELNLSRSQLNNSQLDQLASRLISQRSILREFRLDLRNNSYLNDFRSLSEAIMQLSECDELDLRLDKSFSNGQIANDLKEFSLSGLLGLRKLSLCFDHLKLHYASLVSLFVSIQYLSELKELDLNLSQNSLGNAGVSFLAESLRNLKKLSILKLYFSRIGLSMEDVVSPFPFSLQQLSPPVVQSPRVNKQRGSDPQDSSGSMRAFNSRNSNNINNNSNNMQVESSSYGIEKSPIDFSLSFRQVQSSPNSTDSALTLLSKSIGIMQLLQVINIDFSNNALSSSGLTQLMFYLFANKTNIREVYLDLKQCSIQNCSTVFKGIATYLGESIKILKLNLKGNFNIGPALAMFPSCFAKLTSIQSLSLNLTEDDNTFDDLAVTTLTDNIMFTKSTLKNLALQISIKISEKQLVRFIDGIASLEQLTNLKLVWPDFDGSIETVNINGGFTYFRGIEKLGKLKKLEELTLECNGCFMEWQGVENIAIAIENCTSLRDLALNLSSNCIASPGVIALAHAISSLSNSLQKLELNLAINPIESSSLAKLFQSISELNLLQILDLDLSKIMIGVQEHTKSPPACVLSKLIPTVSPLKELTLRLRKTQIQADCVNSLANRIGSLYYLKELNLDLSANFIEKIPIQQDQITSNPAGTSNNGTTADNNNNIKNPSQQNRKQSQKVSNSNQRSGPMEQMAITLQRLPNLQALRMDLQQNSLTLNRSIFQLTQGIISSCIPIHHLKIKYENWQLCYPPFMLTFIQVQSQIKSLFVRQKLLSVLQPYESGIILQEWDSFLIDSFSEIQNKLY